MKSILIIQGLYYIVTGIWPIVSYSTFEFITGTKTDDWLVRMVGLLAFVIGSTLLFGMYDGLSPTLAFLSCGSALAFLIIDVFYSLKRRISLIYLLDAFPEVIFVLSGGLLFLASV
jgi:hypothetical protein